MAWLPIAQTVPQYGVNTLPAVGYVLKFYASGTNTNIPLATDSTGGTTATDVVLDAQGYPSLSGSIFIPHIDQTYKLALYPSQSAADSDTGAVWTQDNLNAAITSDAASQVLVSSNDTTTGYLNGKFVAGSGVSLTEVDDGANETLKIDTPDKNYTTLALMVADVANLTIGDSVTIKERTTGNGGGAVWDVVDATTVTENGYSIVAGDATRSFQLRDEWPLNFSAWGANGTTDSTANIQAAIEHINDGGETTGEAGATYLITGTIVIPTRKQASQVWRNISFGNATIEQQTTNTPMIQLVAETSNVRIGDFHAKYTTAQTFAQTNGTVIQLRDPETEEEFTGATDVTPPGSQGIWNCLIENITTAGINYPASIISEKDESVSNLMLWGSTIRQLYTFSTRRAIYSRGNGSITGVVNRVQNCVFFGISGNQGTVPFIELRIWTESAISQTEILIVSVTDNLISATGCDIKIDGLRLENCTLEAANKAFILLSGTNNISTVDNFTITNSIIPPAITGDVYGVYSFAGKVKVAGASVAGSKSLHNGSEAAISANFYLLRVAGDGEIVYSNKIRSNIESTYAGSTAYLYKNSDNKNLVVGSEEINYSWQGELDGSTGTAVTQPGHADVTNDGYLVDVVFSTDANLTATIVANLQVNGVTKISTTFATATNSVAKGQVPVMGPAGTPIVLAKGDRLTFQTDPLSQTNAYHITCKVLQFRLI